MTRDLQEYLSKYNLKKAQIRKRLKSRKMLKQIKCVKSHYNYYYPIISDKENNKIYQTYIPPPLRYSPEEETVILCILDYFVGIYNYSRQCSEIFASIENLLIAEGLKLIEDDLEDLLNFTDVITRALRNKPIMYKINDQIYENIFLEKK